MAAPSVLEVAVGPVNGVNKNFSVSASYAPGSTQVWINGQMKRRDFEDGWTELGSNKLQLGQAPQVGDVVQVWYRPL